MLKKLALLALFLCATCASYTETVVGKYDEGNYWDKKGRYGRDHKRDDGHRRHHRNDKKNKHRKKDKHHHKEKHRDRKNTRGHHNKK